MKQALERHGRMSSSKSMHRDSERGQPSHVGSPFIRSCVSADRGFFGVNIAIGSCSIPFPFPFSAGYSSGNAVRFCWRCWPTRYFMRLLTGIVECMRLSVSTSSTRIWTSQSCSPAWSSISFLRSVPLLVRTVAHPGIRHAQVSDSSGAFTMLTSEVH